jgi:hypothetical protein
MTMFEVHPILGVQERDGSRLRYPDLVEISPYGKSFIENNISIASKAPNFPSQGFDLSLRIFYSRSFKNKFGSGTESKYVPVLIFERQFYFNFHAPLYTGLLNLWNILRPS